MNTQSCYIYIYVKYLTALMKSQSCYTLRRLVVCFFFFFSSRRRHTRLQGDWSSDVCSSDLQPGTSTNGSRRSKVRFRGLNLKRGSNRAVFNSLLPFPGRPVPVSATNQLEARAANTPCYKGGVYNEH